MAPEARPRPEDVPLLDPPRYPRNASGQILARVAYVIFRLRALEQRPAVIRLDVYKVEHLAEAFGWAGGEWVLFGIPVEVVAPQVCLDVIPVGAVPGIDWLDRARIEQFLRSTA